VLDQIGVLRCLGRTKYCDNVPYNKIKGYRKIHQHDIDICCLVAELYRYCRSINAADLPIGTRCAAVYLKSVNCFMGVQEPTCIYELYMVKIRSVELKVE
jgi:hypothetical protein